MNKQLQIELWAECRCNRCSFCNLELSAQRSKKLGKEENSPSDLVPNSIKIKYLENGIEYLKTVDWNNYDTLLLRGGEILTVMMRKSLIRLTFLLKVSANWLRKANSKRYFLLLLLSIRIKQAC